MDFTPWVSAILLAPLVGFSVLLFGGQRMLPRQGDWLATGLVALSLALSVYVLYGLLTHVAPHNPRWAWIDLGSVTGRGPLVLPFGFQIDLSAAVMLCVVTGVSLLVHLFSIGYMAGDPRYGRYFAYLNLFTFSMLGIVLADNLLMIYLFWELVGLSSYLLIGFWFERDPPRRAATKAFIVNRIGDVGFWAGILILWSQFETLHFGELSRMLAESRLVEGRWQSLLYLSDGSTVVRELSSGWLVAAGILLFMGVVGKSAQFPLHVWLPDAMEGPTPVSALIHAATMVAAGVYLLWRIYPLLSPEALLVIAFIGAFTAFMAATIALSQRDIKRVLAYSTISQLGYMVMAVGVGSPVGGLFHLVTHAFFKAGLFLGAGSIIHALHELAVRLERRGVAVHIDPQDIGLMGGLRRSMPLTFIAFTLCAAALAGLPLFSGFLSKDAILIAAAAFPYLGAVQGQLSPLWLMPVPLLGFVTAALTALYMGRLWFTVFWGRFRLEERVPEAQGALREVHEAPAVMGIPLGLLGLLSLFFWFSPHPLEPNQSWLWRLLASEAPSRMGPQGAFIPDYVPSLLLIRLGSAEFHWQVLGWSVGMLSVGLLVALWMYGLRRANIDRGVLDPRLRALYRFSREKWYIDRLYEAGPVRVFRALMRLQAAWDRYVIDGAVNGLAALIAALGRMGQRLQTGRVQTYLAVAVLALMVLILWVWR